MVVRVEYVAHDACFARKMENGSGTIPSALNSRNELRSNPSCRLKIPRPCPARSRIALRDYREGSHCIAGLNYIRLNGRERFFESGRPKLRARRRPLPLTREGFAQPRTSLAALSFSSFGSGGRRSRQRSIEEIHELLPVIGGDVMLAGAHVVADATANRRVWQGHLLRAQPFVAE